MALGQVKSGSIGINIITTAFETAQCPLPTINRGRETALRYHLDRVPRATGNDIKSKKLG